MKQFDVKNAIQYGLIAIFIVSIFIQCWFAFTAMDIYHPDEVTQILHPAHNLVFHRPLPNYGPGDTFTLGMRNMAAIYLTACVIFLSKALPFASPLTYLFAVKIMMLILFNWGMYGLYRVAKQTGSVGSMLVVASLLLYVPFLRFGFRTLSETWSIPFLIWGCIWLKQGTRKTSFWAGLSFGAAFIFRYGSGVVLPFLCLVLLVKRQWKMLGYYLAGLIVMLGVLAILDTHQWGTPLYSVWAYFTFNITSGKSELFGVQPWYDYLKDLIVFLPWTLAVIFFVRENVMEVLKRLFQNLSFQVAISYIVIFSAVAHKEFRFIVPIIPLIVMGISETCSGQLFIENKSLVSKKVWAMLSVGICMFVGQAWALNHKIYQDPRTGDHYGWLIENYNNEKFTGLVVIGNIYTGTEAYYHKDLLLVTSVGTPSELRVKVQAHPEISHVLLHRDMVTAEFLKTMHRLDFKILKENGAVLFFEKN